MPGYSRSFTSFAQAADEAGESRVVGGIHFLFDNTAGLTAGRELGRFISRNFLLPEEGHEDEGDDHGGHEGDVAAPPSGPASATPADLDQAAAILLSRRAGQGMDTVGYPDTTLANAGSVRTLSTITSPDQGAAESALALRFRLSVFVSGHGGTDQAGHSSVLASLTDGDGELLGKAGLDRPFDVLTD